MFAAITIPDYIFLTVVCLAGFRQTVPFAKSEYSSWFTTLLSTDAYSNTHQSESLRVTRLISHSHLRTDVPWECVDRGPSDGLCSDRFFLDPLVLSKSHNEFRVSSGHVEDRWKKWQKACAGVTARTRGGGRASRAKLIGWARRSVTTSCGSPLSGCCLNSLMEPINKDGVCARNRMQPEEAAKQAAAGRVKPSGNLQTISYLVMLISDKTNERALRKCLVSWLLATFSASSSVGKRKSKMSFYDVQYFSAKYAETL